MPEALPLPGEEVNGQFELGFICYGVPIGRDKYISHMLDKKMEEVAKGAVKASALLKDKRK